MSRDYMEQETESSQDVGSSLASGAAHLNAGSSGGKFFRVLQRLFCGLWISLFLVLWPSSDWIGLLVLSQALLAAAYLLKSSSAHSAAKSAGGGPISLASGEDHAH